jgi:hypothetical protein
VRELVLHGKRRPPLGRRGAAGGRSRFFFQLCLILPVAIRGSARRQEGRWQRLPGRRGAAGSRRRFFFQLCLILPVPIGLCHSHLNTVSFNPLPITSTLDSRGSFPLLILKKIVNVYKLLIIIEKERGGTNEPKLSIRLVSFLLCSTC